MSKWTGLALAALLAGGMFAVTASAESQPAAKVAGVLHVYDEGKFFSAEGIESPVTSWSTTAMGSPSRSAR